MFVIRSLINSLNPSGNSSRSCYDPPPRRLHGSIRNGSTPFRISISIDRTFPNSAAACVIPTPDTSGQSHSNHSLVGNPLVRPRDNHAAAPSPEAPAVGRNTPIKTISCISPAEQHRGLASGEHGTPRSSFDRSDPAKVPYSFAAIDVRSIYTCAEILADREPYRQENIPLARCSDKAISIEPRVRAWNAKNVFVEGPDGKVRRYPPDRGSCGKMTHEIPVIARRFEAQVHYIYDARVEQIRHTVAEYVVTPPNATMTFKVEGIPCRSVLSDRAMYPLPGKKWMIPQWDFRDCTFACEAMLLTEGQPEDKAAKFVSEMKEYDYRRTLEEICESLRSRSGVETMLITQGDMPGDAFIEQLRTSIERYGPCIFSPHGGHSYICDEVEDSSDGPVFTVRDPFSASCQKIDAHAFLRTPPSARMIEQGADAIFLVKESSNHVS